MLLMSSTLEHILAQRITCKLYAPFEGERGTSPLRNGKFTIAKLKSPRLSWILGETMQFFMDKSKSKYGAVVYYCFLLF